MQATPVALEALTGLARLLARRGEVEQAMAWLTMTVHHPATIGEVRDNATQLLERLSEQLPAPVAASAEARRRNLRLEQALAEL